MLKAELSRRATKWRRLGVSIGASAIETLGLQATALLSLHPQDFGYFSLIYLIGALGNSLMMSCVAEAWARSDRNGQPSDFRRYISAAFYLAICMATAAVLVAIAIPQLRDTWYLAATAVAASLVRGASRFRCLREENWPRVLVPDVGAAVCAAATGIIIFAAFRGSLQCILAAWALTAAFGAAASRLAMPSGIASGIAWVRDHRTSIRPLLRDSIIMDATSIGTPYVIAPVLGVAGFGVYRGVSNVAAPVRLVLNPLRATFSTWTAQRVRSFRTSITALAVSLAAGTFSASTLWWVGRRDWTLGTLSALSHHSIPVGVFITASFLGHFYYLLCRFHVSSGDMLVGRLIQTSLAVTSPIVGAVAWGLGGAIWAYALATAGSATTWTILAATSVEPRHRRPVATSKVPRRTSA